MTFGSNIVECTGVTDLTLPENIENPQDLRIQIQTIQNRMPSLLAEFKTRFVAFQQNPESQDLKTVFGNIQTAITQINAQIYSISGTVEKNTEDLNKRLVCLNALIREEKTQNQKFKVKLGKS